MFFWIMFAYKLFLTVSVCRRRIVVKGWQLWMTNCQMIVQDLLTKGSWPVSCAQPVDRRGGQLVVPDLLTSRICQWVVHDQLTSRAGQLVVPDQLTSRAGQLVVPDQLTS